MLHVYRWGLKSKRCRKWKQYYVDFDLLKIKKDYQSLPKLTEVAESTKYTISEAYNDINNLDLVDCAKIKPRLLTKIEKRTKTLEIIKNEQERNFTGYICAIAKLQNYISFCWTQLFNAEQVIIKRQGFLPNNVCKCLIL